MAAAGHAMAAAEYAANVAGYAARVAGCAANGAAFVVAAAEYAATETSGQSVEHANLDVRQGEVFLNTPVQRVIRAVGVSTDSPLECADL